MTARIVLKQPRMFSSTISSNSARVVSHAGLADRPGAAGDVHQDVDPAEGRDRALGRAVALHPRP